MERRLALIPAFPVLAAVAVAGLVAVLVLPDAASLLPRGDDPEPNATQLAATAAGVLTLTAAYLSAASRGAALGTPWLVAAFAYNAAIVAVKLILSPAAFHGSSSVTLTGYVWVGLVVMLLYAAGLGAVFVAARRRRAAGGWAWPSKAVLVAALLVFAIAGRYVAALVLGETGRDYLDRVFTGSGLWLPAFIAAACVAAIEAFWRAPNPRAALGAGLALIVLYHGLWAVFMLRLF